MGDIKSAIERPCGSRSLRCLKENEGSYLLTTREACYQRKMKTTQQPFGIPFTKLSDTSTSNFIAKFHHCLY